MLQLDDKYFFVGQVASETKKVYFCSLKTAGCSAVGSALRSGRRGRKFESSHPDQHNSALMPGEVGEWLKPTVC